jgi:outer membrane protein OmpA-like peptidoglycan-associated protein
MRPLATARFVALLALCALGGPPARADGTIQQPTGTWQKPGPIQQPTGSWQKPGDIQRPKGLQAIGVSDSLCQKRLTVGDDTLFEFDKATLAADAPETLAALGPLIRQAGAHPVTIVGHTDAIGSNAYNQKLSEARARAVRDWLAGHGFLAAGTPVVGRGKTQPIAPNAKPDGTDDPEGRRKNRRVEVLIDTCR